MNKKGFTLIELLVVIAIIGLLSTLAVVALSSARVKSRDSKRLSDLKQIQTALELYYTEQNTYPTANAQLGTTASACLNASGWSTVGCSNAFMAQIPTDPLGPAYNYIYSAASSTYTVTSSLEGTVSGLSGIVTLSPSGIR